MLTEQTQGSANLESGSGTPLNVANGDAASGSNKTSTPNYVIKIGGSIGTD
jgi:hypothetical protein